MLDTCSHLFTSAGTAEHGVELLLKVVDDFRMTHWCRGLKDECEGDRVYASRSYWIDVKRVPNNSSFSCFSFLEILLLFANCLCSSECLFYRCTVRFDTVPLGTSKET